jgi:protein SCO1/2
MKFLVVCISFLVLCGCQREHIPAPPSVAANVTTNVQRYEVKGVVREVFAERKTVKIDHEKIANYMDAMTMDFEVKNTNELQGLQAGDQVTFRMVVTADDGWIENIKKTGVQQPVVGNAPFAFRRVREVEPLKAGDVMPNYKFTNELGKAVSLDDFRGKAVALTFLFTRCPYPTFCPRMAGNLKEAAKLLKADSSAPTNWHLLAVTIDPEFDTPKVLHDYAKAYGYDPERWSFLTGELIDITAIAEQFGLMFWRPNPEQPTNLSHNLRTVVIDSEGRVQKIIPENKWEPPELADEIKKAAVPAAAAQASQ